MVEHDGIEAAITNLRALLNEKPAFDLQRLLIARAELSGEIEVHLRNEEHLLLDRIDSSSPVALEDMARKFRRVLVAFRTRWEDYLTGWDAQSIAADRAAFCAETEGLIAKLSAGLKRESALLYPAALQAGVIALRGR